MTNIQFRWPEEQNQHAVITQINDRSYKSDDYIDRFPEPWFRRRTNNHV